MARFSKRYYVWALLLVIAIPLVLIGIYTNNLKKAKEAESALQDFCVKHGGYLSWDLVDGDFWIHLENTHLSRKEMKFLRDQWNRLISHDLGGTGVVHLYLSHSTFDGDLVEMLDGKVVGLTLSGLPVDDLTISRIVRTCPQIHTLILDGTKISDKSIDIMKQVPLGMLDVRNTNVTYSGLRRLSGYKRLYAVCISTSNFSSQEMDDLRKHLTCDIMD